MIRPTISAAFDNGTPLLLPFKHTKFQTGFTSCFTSYPQLYQELIKVNGTTAVFVKLVKHLFNGCLVKLCKTILPQSLLKLPEVNGPVAIIVHDFEFSVCEQRQKCILNIFQKRPYNYKTERIMGKNIVGESLNDHITNITQG